MLETVKKATAKQPKIQVKSITLSRVLYNGLQKSKVAKEFLSFFLIERFVFSKSDFLNPYQFLIITTDNLGIGGRFTLDDQGNITGYKLGKLINLQPTLPALKPMLQPCLQPMVKDYENEKRERFVESINHSLFNPLRGGSNL